MVALEIPVELAEKLREVAKRENRSVEAVLETMLKDYPIETKIASVDERQDAEIPPPGTLARLAYEAEKLDFHSGHRDIAERSREILDDEFADYLLKRMKGDNGE